MLSKLALPKSMPPEYGEPPAELALNTISNGPFEAAMENALPKMLPAAFTSNDRRAALSE